MMTARVDRSMMPIISKAAPVTIEALRTNVIITA